MIELEGVRHHNLKNLRLALPRDRLVVITGPSGSGKSSLAFDVLFAEGQRRYIDTLSPYARQFIQQLDRPDVDRVEGIPPAIAIEQRMTRAGAKTTLATLTEVWHYLRLLYAKIGVQHCHLCGKRLLRGSPARIEEEVRIRLAKGRALLLAPLVRGRKGHYRELFERLRKQGFRQVRIDAELRPLTEGLMLDRYREHDVDVVVPEMAPGTFFVAKKVPGAISPVQKALDLGKGFVRLLAGDEETTMSADLACPDCGIGYGEPDPRAFSFNSKRGWCETCEGYGFRREFDADLLVPDPGKSIPGGAILAFEGEPFRKRAAEAFARQSSEALGFDASLPWRRLSARQRDRVLRGDEGFEGLLPRLEGYLKAEKGVANLSRFLREVACPGCRGARLRPESLAVRLGDKTIAEVAALSVSEACRWIRGLRFSEREERVARGVLKELLPKLDLVEELGLGYLSLDRRGDTLSGGESQRIRLAASLGSHLTGVLYVLDEPTIGVHPGDHEILLRALQKLRDRGNSVVVVEHDEETIRRADLLLDLGPGAGRTGGELVFQGRPGAIGRERRSATGRALAGEGRRRVNPRTEEPSEAWVVVRGAREHNLKNLTARFPVGKLTVVTGVSGSGKSTLVRDILFQGLRRKIFKSPVLPGRHDRIDGADHFSRVAEVDQSPIGRTPRSVPASYIGFLDEIRRLFAATSEARARGYSPGRFSFNVEGGRCEACRGQGRVRLEMNFLPDAFMPCEVCQGRRFSSETLEVTFKGKGIAEVLAMTASEAVGFFAAHPSILRRLDLMERVGLGYLTLGQESPTLSGGEAQRIKLVEEIGKWSEGKTLYLLDEPTTGLALSDIVKLIDLLHLLVGRGDTVVVIEHNLEVIKEADWILDLGPQGGGGGGRIVAEGHPLDLARSASRFPQSRTVPYLRDWFRRWGGSG